MPAESIPFISLVIVVFVVFAVSLAWAQWYSQKPRSKGGDAPSRLPAE